MESRQGIYYLQESECDLKRLVKDGPKNEEIGQQRQQTATLLLAVCGIVFVKIGECIGKVWALEQKNLLRTFHDGKEKPNLQCYP